MYDGETFRADCLKGAGEIDAGLKLADPVAAERARLWAVTGAALIDDENPMRAARYLLALAGNLADQNAVNTQMAMWRCTRRLMIPAWIAAASLVWIAVRAA